MDSSAANLLQVIFALAFVIGLMWLLGFLVRRYGEKLGLPVTMPTGKDRRLQIVEVLPMDARSKLVLVRQDASEHLILVGANQAQLIKTDIVKQSEKA